MRNEELKKKIFSVIETSPLGSFATIYEGKPWVRYVMLRVIDGGLYFTAFRHSRKVAQLQADPHCHTILGGNSEDFSKGYVQIAGTAAILDTPEIKKALWQEYHATMFKGFDDPNYIVIQIKPDLIEYWCNGKMEPQVYEP